MWAQRDIPIIQVGDRNSVFTHICRLREARDTDGGGIVGSHDLPDRVTGHAADPGLESALNLLTELHGSDEMIADRDLFSSMKEYNKVWKEVYDSEKAGGLYVLAREDGTIGLGTYRQWKHLCKEHSVPATLLLPHGEQASEVGEFSVSVSEESERSDQVFALVSPEPPSSGSSSSNGGKRKAAGESPSKSS